MYPFSYKILIYLLTTDLLVLQIKCVTLFEDHQIKYSTDQVLENIGNDSFPISMDWRTLGAITEVYDERHFFSGYSWAFSAIEAIESQIFLRNETLFTSLSAQSLIDCIIVDNSTDFMNLTFVFNYLLSDGVLTEKTYPYKPGKDKCDRLANDTKNVVYLDYFIKVIDEIHLKATLATMGPTSALIDASQLKTYKSGIIDSLKCRNTRDALNQAVQVVGYGSENGTDYWIVKNSWGDNWGEKGYARIARNSNNTCGITLEAIYGGILNKTISYN